MDEWLLAMNITYVHPLELFVMLCNKEKWVICEILCRNQFLVSLLLKHIYRYFIVEYPMYISRFFIFDVSRDS